MFVCGGGWVRLDDVDAAPHLHKDKAEIVDVGVQLLNKTPPWVCSGMDC